MSQQTIEDTTIEDHSIEDHTNFNILNLRSSPLFFELFSSTC